MDGEGRGDVQMTLIELWSLQIGHRVKRNDGATCSVSREAIATDDPPFVRLHVDRYCENAFGGSSTATISEADAHRWEQI